MRAETNYSDRMHSFRTHLHSQYQVELLSTRMNVHFVLYGTQVGIRRCIDVSVMKYYVQRHISANIHKLISGKVDTPQGLSRIRHKLTAIMARLNAYLHKPKASTSTGTTDTEDLATTTSQEHNEQPVIYLDGVPYIMGVDKAVSPVKPIR